MGGWIDGFMDEEHQENRRRKNTRLANSRELKDRWTNMLTKDARKLLWTTRWKGWH